MFNKCFIFFTFTLILGQSCDTNTVQNRTDKAVKTDSVATIHQENKGDTLPTVSCEGLMPKENDNGVQKVYAKKMSLGDTALLFLTRDSALYMYRQKDDNCTLLLKLPIDSTRLYSYTDGSPLYLEDLDGDNQKEVLVTVAAIGNQSKFRVYRLTKDKDQIRLKKVRRFEELVSPQFDKESGMVRSHWYERGGYELDEYYKISKDDVLEFVKGFERSNGKDRHYTTKAKW